MKTAFLFPGQGAQTVGMGKELYNNNHIYKETFDLCEQSTQLDLKAACFEGIRMDESEVVQPAIFAHSISLFKVLQDEGVQADIYAGLSLGEYSALCAAGVFDVAQCAALVRSRGKIMDNALPKGEGGMLSIIGFDVAKVEETIAGYDDVYVANHLSELQIVIAGKMSTLQTLEQVIQEAGAKMVTMLSVSGPFHSPLLSDAADTFLELLHGQDIGNMMLPVYSNVLGKPYSEDSDIKQLLAQQMHGRVKWHDCTEDMIAGGVERFIEIGPGGVLTKLIKRRVGKDGAQTISVKDAGTLDKFLSKRGE